MQLVSDVANDTEKHHTRYECGMKAIYVFNF